MEEIKTKRCSKCKIEKNISLYNKNGSCLDGLSNVCRECQSIYKKEYYLKNKEYIINKVKDRCLKKKDDISKYQKEYRNKNNIKLKEYISQWNKENKENLSLKKKEYYLNNREVILKKSVEYRAENIDEIKRKSKKSLIYIAKYSTFADRLTVEEDSICKNNDELWCRCAKCREYFPVKRGQIKNRLQSLVGNLRGEHRLYCSEKCKQECDIYYSKNTPKSQRDNSNQARCNQQINKKALLDLQMDEFGYTFCEVCGKPLPRKYLIIHHNIPVGDDISEADNMSHQILVCKDHHQHNGCLGKS